MGDAVWVPAFSELMSVATDIRDKASRLYIEQQVQLAKSDHGDGGSLPPGQEQEVRRQAAKQAHALFDDVPGLFQPFADSPSPDGFNAAIAALTQAQADLATSATASDPLSHQVFPPADAFARVSTTSDFLNTWTGKAARHFKADYLDRLPNHTSAQFQLASVLAAAMEAERSIWSAARSDIRSIAAEGDNALDHVNDCTQAEWTIAFTVVASVAGVAAVPFTGGASLALTAVAGAAQIAAAVPIDEAPETDYSGDSPQEVVQAIREAVHELVDRIREAEQKIADALTTDVGVVDGNWHQFVSDRPDLADADVADVKTDKYLGSAK